MASVTFSAEQATLDEVRRACIALGTALPRDASAAREQIAVIQQQADMLAPGDASKLAALAQDLERYVQETLSPNRQN
jgi:hypothetical protein